MIYNNLTNKELVRELQARNDLTDIEHLLLDRMTLLLENLDDIEVALSKTRPNQDTSTPDLEGLDDT